MDNFNPNEFLIFALILVFLLMICASFIFVKLSKGESLIVDGKWSAKLLAKIATKTAILLFPIFMLILGIYLRLPWWLVVIFILTGPISYFIQFYVTALFLNFVGRFFDGKQSKKE